MILSIIAAIGKNNELGKGNTLLWHMASDMKHFRETTSGHTVIMGRKTFESLPGGPLPKRKNIVVTRDENYKKEGVEVVHSLEKAVDLVKNEDEAFIIGGGELYKQAMPFANKLYLTRVESEDKDADTFFPIVGSEWKETKREDFQADEKNPYNYSFVEYEK